MSPSSAPPAPTIRKRPWYLVVALVIASVFGAWSFQEGVLLISYYRNSDADLLTQELRQIDDESDRAAVKASLDHMNDELDASKSRMFPLAAAELLLGMALFALAAGAMAGRPGARTALVQVVFVQGALVVAMFFLTARFRAAAQDHSLAKNTAELKQQGGGPLSPEDQQLARKGAHVLELAQLTFRSIVAGLVLVALTRKRSVAYYEQAAEG